MFPRLGIIALMKTEPPPDDFWPPRRHDDAIRPAHAFANEPAIMLRLIGVVAAIAIMIAAALMSA